MKNIIIIAIQISIFCPSYGQIVSESDSIEKGGLEIPSSNSSKNLAVLIPRATTDSLPSEVDLSDYLPKPRNQFGQGSCAAWAIAYGLKSYQEAIEANMFSFATLSNDIDEENKSYSPAFIFNQARMPVRNCKNGITIEAGLDFLKKNGVSLFSAMRYNKDDCSSRPKNNSIKQEAKKYRILDWISIYPFDEKNKPSVQLFKETLWGDGDLRDAMPVIVGVLLDKNVKLWNKFDEINYKNRRIKVWKNYNKDLDLIPSNYHAMLCIGYNDSLNAFKFLNSWGQEIGDNGYIWIDYNVFKEVVKEGFIAYDVNNSDVIDGIEKEQIGPSNVTSSTRDTISALFRKELYSNKLYAYNSRVINVKLSINLKFSGGELKSIKADTIVPKTIKTNKIQLIEKPSLSDTLTPKSSKKTVSTSENREDLKTSDFVVRSWIKEGYYRNFDNIRVGLVSLNENDNSSIIRFTDLEEKKEIGKLKLYEKKDNAFEYKDKTYYFCLDKIDKAPKTGWFSTNQAAYFTLIRADEKMKLDSLVRKQMTKQANKLK